MDTTSLQLYTGKFPLGEKKDPKKGLVIPINQAKEKKPTSNKVNKKI